MMTTRMTTTKMRRVVEHALIYTCASDLFRAVPALRVREFDSFICVEIKVNDNNKNKSERRAMRTRKRKRTVFKGACKCNLSVVFCLLQLLRVLNACTNMRVMPSIYY